MPKPAGGKTLKQRDALGHVQGSAFPARCRSDVPARAARYLTHEPARGERRAARAGEDGSGRGDPQPTPEQNDAKPRYDGSLFGERVALPPKRDSAPFGAARPKDRVQASKLAIVAVDHYQRLDDTWRVSDVQLSTRGDIEPHVFSG